MLRSPATNGVNISLLCGAGRECVLSSPRQFPQRRMHINGFLVSCFCWLNCRLACTKSNCRSTHTLLNSHLCLPRVCVCAKQCLPCHLLIHGLGRVYICKSRMRLLLLFGLDFEICSNSMINTTWKSDQSSYCCAPQQYMQAH